MEGGLYPMFIEATPDIQTYQVKGKGFANND